MPDQELDVRDLRKPDKHPTVFAAYDALDVGGWFVLINDHDPRHLRDEFEAEHPGSHRWEYLVREPRDWRIRIGKLSSTPLPRVLYRTSGDADADAGAEGPRQSGAVWNLSPRARDLDANLIQLLPDAGIDAHAGPELDVLIHVIDGGGTLTTELGEFALTPGAVVWLPRRSRRQFAAGPTGLRYLTVHQRRTALVLDTARGGR